MREGWKCPACGRGNSPDSKTCPCKPRVLKHPWKPIEPPPHPYTKGGGCPEVGYLNETWKARGAPSWH